MTTIVQHSRPEPNMLSQVTDRLAIFDRFTGRASRLASPGPLFVFCVALVVVWAPSCFVLKDFNTWQLIINTLTTIAAFLMVALLQNSHYRSDEATHTSSTPLPKASTT